jgi:hypothetical protein
MWELLSEADEICGSDEQGRALYPLAVDNPHAFEEVFQLCCVLHRPSDFSNSIKPKSASIAFHAMAQSLNSPEILLAQCASKCLDILFSIIQKDRDNIFKVSTNLYSELVCWFGL